jgi:calcium permeable stress-gated cation channel
MSDPDKECPKPDLTDPANGQKQIYVQAVLSLALGATAFICFCVSIIVDRTFSSGY